MCSNCALTSSFTGRSLASDTSQSEASISNRQESVRLPVQKSFPVAVNSLQRHLHETPSSHMSPIPVSSSSLPDEWWRHSSARGDSELRVGHLSQTDTMVLGQQSILDWENELPDWKEYAFHETATSKGTKGGVPVFVMLPLDSVTMNNTLNRRRALNASLLALKSAGVEGIMMDVWWGIVEKDGPQTYNWSAYRELIDIVRNHGLKVQAVMSFHQCGGNVGDSCK